MRSKAFVFALCIILATFQASTQSPTTKEANINEIVIGVFAAVLKIADKFLEKATTAVDNLEENSEQIQQEIVTIVVENAQSLKADLLKLVDQLRAGATDDGKSVLDCILKAQSTADEELEKTATDFGTCAASQTPTVIAGVRDVLGQLKTFADNLQVPLNELSQCASEDSECLQDFVVSELVVFENISAAVTEDIQKLMELIQTISSNVSECSASVVDEIKNSVQNVFNEVVVCIKQ